MRDPARIDRLVELLRAVWNAHPDWRLGQLIMNVNPNGHSDPFHIPDDQWERALRAEVPQEARDGG